MASPLRVWLTGSGLFFLLSVFLLSLFNLFNNDARNKRQVANHASD
jgi:hypothetical protein